MLNVNKKIIQLKSYYHHRKELLKSFLKIFLMLKSDDFMSVKGEIEHITTLIKDSYSRSFFRRFSFYLISNWEFIGHLVLHQAWIVKNQNRFTRPHKLPSSSYGNGGPYRKPTSDGHSEKWINKSHFDYFCDTKSSRRHSRSRGDLVCVPCQNLILEQSWKRLLWLINYGEWMFSMLNKLNWRILGSKCRIT